MTPTTAFDVRQRSDSLAPVYLDPGPMRALDAQEVAATFTRAGLGALARWSFSDGQATSSLVRFARRDAVPPWVGAHAMLDPSFSPPPTIAAETRMSVVQANLNADTARFQLELSDVGASLARVWADSLLATLTPRRTSVGRVVAVGFGFVVDTGRHLLRASWLPEPSAPSDSRARVAIAARESGLLLSRLEAGSPA